MAKTNTAPQRMTAQTHEGGRANAHQKPIIELERAVATCLLWENTFYETGNDIAARIETLCKKVKPEDVAALAIKARNEYKLRHVPLFLMKQLASLAAGRADGLVRRTLTAVIQRPDEMGEFIALYWKEKKRPLSAQIKKGLRDAFGKFSPYQIQKWNRDSAIKLRDVMFLVAPKANADRLRNEGEKKNKAKGGRHAEFSVSFNELPRNEREMLYWKLANNELESADTWEVALSAGKDKKATWERLLSEKKLGFMALLMNLRNMEESGVDRMLVQKALTEGAPNSKALPFRFISAQKHAPSYAQAISDAMLSAISPDLKLPGSTLLVVDVSGSMIGTISAKSEMTRWEAAGALAILLREICDTVRVFTFSNDVVEVPNLRGLGMIRAIQQSQPNGGTELAKALRQLKKKVEADRVIVITDEQTHDGNEPMWTKHGYICNVAPYQPGLELSGGWCRINGWSERIVDWIRFEEQTNNVVGSSNVV